MDSALIDVDVQITLPVTFIQVEAATIVHIPAPSSQSSYFGTLSAVLQGTSATTVHSGGSSVYSYVPSSAIEKFRRLAAQWRAERGPTSSVSQMAIHPAYQQIIGMGMEVVPLLLGELAREVDHWFWALKSITGINPVPRASQGKMREMAEAWLHWGRQQGYLS